MSDPDAYVIVVDAGPQFFRKPAWAYGPRKPAWAYGPFPTVADAEAWVNANASRWDATLGGWDWRVVRMGTQGAIRVEDPHAPARPLG